VYELTVEENDVGRQLQYFRVFGIEGTLRRGDQQAQDERRERRDGPNGQLYDVSAVRPQMMIRESSPERRADCCAAERESKYDQGNLS
jgi:hypothetical protein